jgi:hypothetical protein
MAGSFQLAFTVFPSTFNSFNLVRGEQMSDEDGEQKQNKIHNYVVLPELNASCEKTEPNVAIKQLIDFIKQKTQESQKVGHVYFCIRRVQKFVSVEVVWSSIAD